MVAEAIRALKPSEVATLAKCNKDSDDSTWLIPSWVEILFFIVFGLGAMVG